MVDWNNDEKEDQLNPEMYKISYIAFFILVLCSYLLCQVPTLCILHYNHKGHVRDERVIILDDVGVIYLAHDLGLE